MKACRTADIPSAVGSTWGWLSASFQRRHVEIKKFWNLAPKPKSKRRLFFLSFWDKKEKIHHILHLHQNDTGTIRLPRREGWLEGQRKGEREEEREKEREEREEGVKGEDRIWMDKGVD